MAEQRISIRYLESFRDRFEPVFKAYLEHKAARLSSINPLGGELANVVRDFAEGSGKRIRPALVELGFKAVTGEESAAILQPALALELLHTFFLVHDDIMDRSDLRRNRPTVHVVFGRRYADLLRGVPDGYRGHFALSLALLAGDLCCAIGYEALSKSAFPSDRILAAINMMHAMVDATVIGQALDTVKPMERDVTESDVAAIHLLKTAKYSFEGPLCMGMVLAGVSTDLLTQIRGYAVNVGIAFQIQDDILGVFGTTAELGKPTISDLAEGKQTLLLVTALHRGSPQERERLRSLLGRQGLSDEELEEARTIMRSTGALVHSEERARSCVAAARAWLDEASIDSDVRSILADLAEYVVDRKS